jgi:hypothetical protein
MPEAMVFLVMLFFWLLLAQLAMPEAIFWLLLAQLAMPEATSFFCGSKLLRRTSALSTKLAIGEVTPEAMLFAMVNCCGRCRPQQ